ncbi:PREDICTED: hemicentin-2 isoform X1 [Papilio polytes]|uniref:hemicentin-2 isoform X1 n=1 Tax=Papilio polytes TaxID=76194 RepID=UPI000676178F|nr:PREDICTED: hemicentin-2 isoform X1 [Papilio polytes]XP_013147816.1 PREDICTED: hemicentin-2 isoform X1 [Papilio polytes]XP_013147817.1 PREDICTED: hemicentin-2 isoform X1 [Papilio polytes]
MPTGLCRFFASAALLGATLAMAAKSVPMTQLVAVAGEPVYLPCDIATQDEDDAVLLVLWYREDLGTPIYSVDARERDFGVAERWSDESVFASRAYFLPERRPAELGVDRVRASDQGIYRCRVDFKQAQTRNSRVNLTVIVPPSKMVITDDKGDVKQAIVGPYIEGDTFTLKCDVTGGRPRPWVKWFRDDVEVDTAAAPLAAGVRGVLHVGPLSRADVRATLTCRASNHLRAHPIETTLTLDMNFPPLSVHILGSNQPLSASRRYDLLCQSSGSRPPASITWWKNGHRINNAKETLSSDGNTTTSTVSLQLTKSDAGAKLACRASNPQMPSVAALEDDWLLDIQYVPETTVRLGTNLDPKNIKEGSDVYFDCIIKAHPYVYKVEWRHNGKSLVHNVGHGIIITNQSLVLQGVGRKTAGNYTCVGFNAEGDGESKPFTLNVLYAPTCRSSQQRVHGVAKQERAHITCHVDANPADVSFRWTFNNTANSNDVSEGYVSRAGTSSTVSYTPRTELDYGTLLCWARNRIGRQRVPCVYHIIAAGRPDQVHNCTVVNASLTSFGVRCSEGFNGGLPQSFLLEVREIVTQEIIGNVSSAVPRFTAVGLEPGRTYAAAVLAYNAKGRGDPYPLRASTLRPPEKHHVHDKSLDLPRTAFQISGAMSAAVGCGGVLMVVLVLLMLAVRQKCAKRKPRSAPPPSQPASPDKLREKDDSESDDRNPDIIPSDTDHMQIDYFRQQQVSTISPPPGSRAARGSVAGVRGGIPAYCPLRTAPPGHPQMHDTTSAPSSIPPPARFASGACTLPRGAGACGTSGAGIPLQHLRTLPRPLPAPAPAPRHTPRDTPL